MAAQRCRGRSGAVRGGVAALAALAVVAVGLSATPAQASAFGRVHPVDTVATGSFTGVDPVEVPGPTGLWSAAGTSSTVPMPISSGTAAGSVVQVPVARIATTTTTIAGVPVTILQGAENDAARPAPRPTAAMRTTRPTGVPGAIAVQVWTNRAYPSATDTKAAVPVSVVAVDTDGSPLAFSGSARVVNGSSTDTTFSAPRGTTDFLVDTTGLSVGSATIAVSLSGPRSTAPVQVTVPITLLPATVSQVSAAVPFDTVFPDAYGYHDTLPIRLQSVTSTGGAVRTRGVAEILHEGVLVTRWTITSSKQVLHWDGLIDGAVHPGTYTLRLSVAGANGTTHVTTRTLTVSSKQLVTEVHTGHFAVIGKHGVSTSHALTSPDGRVTCVLGQAALDCTAKPGAGGRSSRVALPPIVLPQSVLAMRQYGPISIRFTRTLSALRGGAEWITGSKTFPARPGHVAYGWVTVPAGATVMPTTLLMTGAGHIAVTSATFEYRYSSLQ